MSRRVYGWLCIGRRHPRLLGAMHRTALDRSDVVDGSYGEQRPNAAMSTAADIDDALRQLRRQQITWPQVPMRADGPAERRRSGPQSSRFGAL